MEYDPKDYVPIGDSPQPFVNPVLVLATAMHLATECHKFQRRKGDDSPYINHPVGVMTILIDIGHITDHEVLSAALLHDVVEDTSATMGEIKDSFGDRVAHIVMQVTDDKSMPKAERKRVQIQRANVIEPDARCVKLADKIYNLQDLLAVPPKGWSEERIRGYFAWAKSVVDNMPFTNYSLEKLFYDTVAKKLGDISDEDLATELEAYLDEMSKVDN